MSVCSATAAASSRPGCRRESRNSNTRASTSDAQQFFIDRSGGNRMGEQRKYSTVSNSKSHSSSTLCCSISVVMTFSLALLITGHTHFVGFIG